MKSFIPMYQQSQQMQMQKQQMGLQQQLAQMQNQRQQQQFDQSQEMAPFEQRKLQAETGLAEAKTAGYPQQAQQQQAKMALGWAQKVMEANSKDPNFSKDPANQQSLAKAMQIQNSFLSAMQQGQPQQGKPMQQGSQMQQSVIPGQQQPQQAPQQGLGGLIANQQAELSPEYMSALQDAQRAKQAEQLNKEYTPEDRNRITRINSAKKAYDEITPELTELLPYMTRGESAMNWARNYATKVGIPLNDATMRVNALKKKMEGLSAELAPGFGVPRTEKSMAGFLEYVNPQKGGFNDPSQIMKNWNSVGSLMDNVGSTLMQSKSEQIQEGKRLFGKKPKKGSTWNTNAQQQPQAQQLSPEHRQILLAEKQRRAALKSQGGV